MKFNKLFKLTLAMVMAISMTACDNDDDDSIDNLDNEIDQLNISTFSDLCGGVWVSDDDQSVWFMVAGKYDRFSKWPADLTNPFYLCWGHDLETESLYPFIPKDGKLYSEKFNISIDFFNQEKEVMRIYNEAYSETHIFHRKHNACAGQVTTDKGSYATVSVYKNQESYNNDTPIYTLNLGHWSGSYPYRGRFWIAGDIVKFDFYSYYEETALIYTEVFNDCIKKSAQKSLLNFQVEIP